MREENDSGRVEETSIWYLTPIVFIPDGPPQFAQPDSQTSAKAFTTWNKKIPYSWEFSHPANTDFSLEKLTLGYYKITSQGVVTAFSTLSMTYSTYNMNLNVGTQVITVESLDPFGAVIDAWTDKIPRSDYHTCNDRSKIYTFKKALNPDFFSLISSARARIGDGSIKACV